MKKLLFSILLLFLLVSMGSPADVYNIGKIYRGNTQKVPTTGDIVAIYEDYSHVVYVLRYTWIDSSDNAHWKPLNIGNCNVSDGSISAIQSATGDANILFHFSADDRNSWRVNTTQPDLDAVSSTAKYDTLGYNEASDDLIFHNNRWLVVEAASGSSTNQDDNIITIVLKFKKETPTAVYNGNYVRMAGYSNSSGTNP